MALARVRSNLLQCRQTSRIHCAPFRLHRFFRPHVRWSAGYPPLPSEPKSPKTWVDVLPVRARPYLLLARADKPIGTLLLFYPCAWSITMASCALSAPPVVPATFLCLFGAGAFIMRGAGCTINDLWDHKLDRAVDRTKERPLSNGDVTLPRAVAFLGGQLSAGLLILLQLNWQSVLLGAASLPIVSVYPFMKRVTYWPQFVLGLAFNWGALLGWSAVAGAVNWHVCLPLYASGICWTLVYDSIYAHQDKMDDVKVGIRSTALLFGEHTRQILSIFSMSTLSFLTLAGHMAGSGIPFYVGMGMAAAQLSRIIYRSDFNSKASCWQGFTGCGWVGFWVWMGALGDYLMLIIS